MMRVPALLLTTSSLAAVLLGGHVQAQNTTISPPKPLNCNWYKAPFNRLVGDHLGGTGVINYGGLTAGANNHFQCLDGSLKGKGPITGISQVAFHQYGATCSPCNSGVESYAGVTVTMAEFNYANASNIFAVNLAQNAAVVLNNKRVSLPDWSTLPPSLSNSPYDLAFPFDQMYFYSGNNDLCTDIVATGGSFGTKMPSTRTAYAAAVLDGEPIYSCSLDIGNPDGQGCRVPGRSKDFNLFVEVAVSTATNASLNVRLAEGPPNQAAILGFAPIALNAPIPNWCQPVLQVPLVFLPGNLNQNGQWNASFPTTAYNSALVGQSIYLQGAATEPTQNQFMLTNIAHSVMPRVWTSPSKFLFQAMSVPDTTSVTGTLTRRAPVIQYTHL